jgi:hypothetical protein
MERRTVFCVLVLMLLVGGTLAQEAAPTPAPAEPAPQATPAPPPVEPAAPAPAAPAPVTVPRIYFDKAKVVVDGKADFNGALELEWKPLNGEAKLIQVNVLAKMKAKDIAGDVYKEIALAAGASYKVKLSGDRIEVKKANKQAPNFAITITKLQVPGVSLRVEK